VFKNTSATYKFYWFLAIIDSIEKGKEKIDKKELFARMLANAWYTVNYFHVSFGKQDLIQTAIQKIKSVEQIPIDCAKEKIVSILYNSNNPETIRELKHFDKNVPHKFLSPWLGSGAKKEIYNASQLSVNKPLYALYENYIVIDSDWKGVILINLGIIKSFVLWHLSRFLQTRNPNVNSIPEKLIKPPKRASLLKHKRDYWDLVIKEIGFIDCIYTGKRLVPGTYAVEHFLPYQYVVHDLMWNLIPADPIFNSIKSDKLPPFDRYFNSFYEVQKIGLDIIRRKRPKNKFLEDFLPIFPDLEIDNFKYAEHVKPLLSIAHNNGFQYLANE